MYVSTYRVHAVHGSRRFATIQNEAFLPFLRYWLEEEYKTAMNAPALYAALEVERSHDTDGATVTGDTDCSRRDGSTGQSSSESDLVLDFEIARRERGGLSLRTV